MNLTYAPYELRPRSALNAQTGGGPRMGALIRAEFAPGSYGYADLHPWPEWGDAGLAEQLLGGSLLQQSLWMAKRDHDARVRGTSLLENSIGLLNNFVIPDLLAGSMSRRGFGR